MTMKKRLDALERRLADVPNVETIIAETRRLERWLAERGLTAEEALARRERGPEGLRSCTLAGIIEAKRRVAEYRAQRFGGLGTEPDSPV